ncbi:DinB family protein [Eionea flava]
MNNLSADMSHLLACNIDILNTARDMIQHLPADKYNHVERPYFESCLGKHIRHILDHYLCFIRDVETGMIDYEKRQRDTQTETNQEYALGVINNICDFLKHAQRQHLEDGVLSVWLCNDVALPEGEATRSSVRRELQFLHGHTVHHYALIATMLRFYGIETDRTLGVAPSTLIHEQDTQSESACDSSEYPQAAKISA